MDILILGGTRFVGRHLVEAALASGHNVTLFNRGQTNPGMYPQVEELHGDRDGGLDALRGRSWDVVFDVNGYVPRIVRQSADLLKNQVRHYVFVSSISVYADIANDTAEDSTNLHELDDPTVEDVNGATYGGLKVLCEREVSAIYGDRGGIVRAGLVVGRYDHYARLPYLIKRFMQGGERLAGRADQPVQLIHGRDLAEWMLGAAAQDLSGSYNVTGSPTTMDALLQTINQQVQADNTIIYTDDAFLHEHSIVRLDGLTYWLPLEMQGVMQASVQKALNTGLKLRGINEIVRDVVAWEAETGAISEGFNDDPHGNLLTPQRETELLAAWHSR